MTLHPDILRLLHSLTYNGSHAGVRLWALLDLSQPHAGPGVPCSAGRFCSFVGSTFIPPRTTVGGPPSSLRRGGDWLLLTGPWHQAASQSQPETASDHALGAMEDGQQARVALPIAVAE